MIYFVLVYFLLVLSTHLIGIFNANTIAPLAIAYGAILYYFFRYMRTDNIVRFSAHEIVEGMGGDWKPTIKSGQLVLEKAIAGDVSVAVFTSVKIGDVAGAKGEDSVRVVLKEGDRYRKKGRWITREYPTRIARDRRWTYDTCTAHVFGKILDKVTKLTEDVQECPKCETAQVRLVSKSQKNPGRPFWKCQNCSAFEWADS